MRLWTARLLASRPSTSTRNRDREDLVEQEPLIDAVLEANAENTAVVLKTSGTVLMPWLDKVPAVLRGVVPRHGGWQCRR